MTFSDIIEKIGNAPLAELLAVEESHVRTMKARDSIPPEYWGLVIEEAERRAIAGVTFEALLHLRKERFARARNGEDAA